MRSNNEQNERLRRYRLRQRSVASSITSFSLISFVIKPYSNLDCNAPPSSKSFMASFVGLVRQKSLVNV